MAPAAIFSKDEKALCFHHELLYEAKILDVKPHDSKKGSFLYKVHYKGWKNTWDDWVPQDRLRKFTEENFELAKSLKKEMDALRHQSKPTVKSSIATKRRGGDASARGSEERSSVAAVAGKKRGRDFEVEREDAFNAKPAIRIIMPDALKSILVDDWENVTKSLQLASLPSKTPVSMILDEYVAQEMTKHTPGSASADILEEVIAGLKEYFNKSLGRLLLYRFERSQYQDLLSRIESATDKLGGKQLSDVYGAEHLLRLFVSLPELIAQTNMDQQSVGRLREELCKITMWLAKMENINRYLSAPYESQGADYQEQANN